MPLIAARFGGDLPDVSGRELDAIDVADAVGSAT
jgi:hypothetical protein